MAILKTVKNRKRMGSKTKRPARRYAAKRGKTPARRNVRKTGRTTGRRRYARFIEG